ncbi:ScbA/BarX family gamma-butyrolactone biosynthesis protein [Arthrobacter sp. NPDC058130]|uniref:ScbA/BarX family gamma-butyrolactone biosynthesis protein n=1 Tax=Arthrobacter sp. NPDC058130 TaxID=3346353 RepID=UPI0036E7E9E7
MVPDNSECDRRAKDRFGATIPRELVHRRAISEVLLTGIHTSGNAVYTVSAQWPRWHVFFGSVRHGFDSALVVETLRQLTVLVAHTQLNVPLGMQFLMPDMSVSMAPGALQDPSRPAEVTVEVVVTDIRAAVQGVTAFRTSAIFFVDGQRIAAGTAGARIVTPEAYNRIRSHRGVAVGCRMGRPVPAAEVGHLSPWNVVLNESSDTGHWPLRVDVSNPILFDHPLDHVPGVLLIEAVRQAVRLAFRDPCLDFLTVEAQFVSIAEFSDEATVVLESVSDGPEPAIVHASIQAAGRVRMQARITAKRLVSTGIHQWKSVGTERSALRENLHA